MTFYRIEFILQIIEQGFHGLEMHLSIIFTLNPFPIRKIPVESLLRIIFEK